ncbi:hypothetical protein CSKR_107815 [Clonorchis sinensis]|uniref:Uncharacterized protein n=1 Tax=Clonorchis sinensis TaxID=79923 RepID=A0A3R7D6N8_CLOSI|nr:hypothetical protein CSKR_107815 [Clonorchis sinensis]
MAFLLRCQALFKSHCSFPSFDWLCKKGALRKLVYWCTDHVTEPAQPMECDQFIYHERVFSSEDHSTYFSFTDLMLQVDPANDPKTSIVKYSKFFRMVHARSCQLFDLFYNMACMAALQTRPRTDELLLRLLHSLTPKRRSIKPSEKKSFSFNILPVPSCYVTRRNSEVWYTAKLSKPRHGKSRCRGRVRTTEASRHKLSESLESIQ